MDIIHRKCPVMRIRKTGLGVLIQHLPGAALIGCSLYDGHRASIRGDLSADGVNISAGVRADVAADAGDTAVSRIQDVDPEGLGVGGERGRDERGGSEGRIDSRLNVTGGGGPSGLR